MRAEPKADLDRPQKYMAQHTYKTNSKWQTDRQQYCSYDQVVPPHGETHAEVRRR